MAASSASVIVLRRTRVRPSTLMFVLGLPVIAVLFGLTALDYRADGALWENAHWTLSALIAFLATVAAVGESDGADRRTRRDLALAMASYLVGQVVWDVQVATNAVLVPAPSDFFFLLTGALSAAAVVRSVRGRVTNAERLALYVDGAVVFLAISTVIMAVYGERAERGGQIGVVLLLYPILFLATGGAGAVVALATRAQFAFRGLYALFGGFAALAVAWVVWVEASLTQIPPVGAPVNLLFSMSILVVGFGAATWTARSDEDPAYGYAARYGRAVLTIGAVGASVAYLIGSTRHQGTGQWWEVGDVTAAGVIGLTLLRQWILARDNGLILARERASREREQASREEALAALNSQRESERRYRSVVDIFSRLAERITFAADDAELVAAARHALGRLVPTERGNALLLNPSQDRLVVATAWGREALKPGSNAPIDRPVRCPGIRRGAPYHLPDASDELAPGCPAMPATHGSSLCGPMLALGQVVGVLHLYREAADAFDADTQYQASRVAEQTALAIANARLVSTMEGLAMTDPLTGLHNARFFDPLLDRELAAAKRSGQPVGVMMIDLDHFKRFNDTYGHPAGDLALKAFASTLVGQLRDSDTVARYGGEEFAVALRDTDLDGTARVAEKVREAVAQIAVELGPGRFGRIRMSAGVANSEAHGHDRLALMRTADDALYRAKEQGRDRVVVAEPRAGAGPVDPKSARRRIDDPAADAEPIEEIPTPTPLPISRSADRSA